MFGILFNQHLRLGSIADFKSGIDGFLLTKDIKIYEEKGRCLELGHRSVINGRRNLEG